MIHHYETFQVLQTLLAPGMDREVVPDFYSFLVHTGSTHTGFECDIWAWRDRKFHNNYPPHGWCAARFTERFRNMLVREDMANPVLHLASALSPAWLNAGQRVRVANTPTDFGTLSFATAHRPQPSPHRALTSATCGTCAARHLPGHALIGGPAYGRLHSSTWRFAGMDTGCMS